MRSVWSRCNLVVSSWSNICLAKHEQDSLIKFIFILPCVLLSEIMLIFLLKIVLPQYLHESTSSPLVILCRLLLMNISSVRSFAWDYLLLEQIYRESLWIPACR